MSPLAIVPRIVVLDGYTMNPGDLDWGALSALGELKVWDRTASADLIERSTGAALVLTSKVRLDAETIAKLPDLRYIGVTATGYDVIDIEAARERNIVVTNVPAYSTASVAQTVFAHLLNLTQHVGEHAQQVREGRWAAAPDWCYWDHPLTELEGKTLGIIGLGQIGRATAKLALAFGMRVVATTRSKGGISGVELVELHSLLRQSDVVSLHCPLTPQTEKIINRETLGMMRPSAFLINTSRGAAVDELALAEALNTGKLAGAGLDVLESEPPCHDNPLFTAKNCYVTPHLSWATQDSRCRLMDVVVANVAAFIKGQPQNVVS